MNVTRLGQLIRLLASDNDAEVLAAARALKKFLATHKKDMNDFASVVERLLTVRPVHQTVIIVHESMKQNQKRRYEEARHAAGQKTDKTV